MLYYSCRSMKVLHFGIPSLVDVRVPHGVDEVTGCSTDMRRKSLSEPNDHILCESCTRVH